jgi:mutator protein MutT
VRRYPDRPIVGVGAIILDGDRVLLVKRGQAPMLGEWSLPGGAVELGETLAAAVVREVQEETGLHVEVGPLIEAIDRVHLGDDGRVEYHYVVIDYLCRVRDGNAAHGSDAADICWAHVGDLGPYRLTAVATAVIQKAVARAQHA